MIVVPRMLYFASPPYTPSTRIAAFHFTECFAGRPIDVFLCPGSASSMAFIELQSLCTYSKTLANWPQKGLIYFGWSCWRGENTPSLQRVSFPLLCVFVVQNRLLFDQLLLNSGLLHSPLVRRKLRSFPYVLRLPSEVSFSSSLLSLLKYNYT